MYGKIISTGSYLPPKIIDNYFFEKYLDTTHEWIITRSGINTRHRSDNESASTMGSIACNNALRNIQNPESIQAIVCTTSTPDKTFPATAAIIANKINANNAAIVFDINGVCNGFVYGITIIDALISNLGLDNALLVSTEHLSSILDYNNRETCILFGDGASAVLFKSQSRKLILGHSFGSDVKLNNILQTTGGVSTTGNSGCIEMSGRAVFKVAVRKCIECILEALENAKLSMCNIDYIIVHQANIRIIQSVASNLNIDIDRMLVTIDKHGNTSSASIPLCIDYYVRTGTITAGNKIALCGIGSGMSWGCVIIDY